MQTIASWIREKDEPLFARFVASHPTLELRNARTGAADFSEMRGLLLTGGPDVSAGFLHQPVPEPSLIQDAEPARDAWEFAAVTHALEKRLPIFAVCKGVQLLNVALGGTLRLDIPGHDLPEQREHNVQPLRFAADATRRIELVNSSHHQALDRLGDGLAVEAWSAEDDIIEQVRLRDYPFAFGVQYHPERDELYTPLFELFFEEVKKGSG